MYRRFTGIHAQPYSFRERDGSERPLVALVTRDKTLGFVEFGEALIRLANELIDLDDEHDRQLRERSLNTQGPTP